MSDLNDFYAFNITSGGIGNSSGGNGCGIGCSTVLIVLAVLGWVLWFIGKFLA